MIHIAKEPFSVLEEMLPLISAHVEEVYYRKDIDIDTESYKSFVEADLYHPIGMRLNGKLIGYAGFFVRTHLHFKTKLFAYCDLMYVIPEHRGAGGKLISWCDDYFKNLGVDTVMHYVTTFKDYSLSLEKRGYILVDKVFAKKL